MAYLHTCPHCSIRFLCTKASRKFCSRNCMRDFKVANKNNASCQRCGMPYYRKPRDAKTSKYCSYSCAAKSRTYQPQKFSYTCKQCNKPFSTRYKHPRACCSPKCAGLYKRKGRSVECPLCKRTVFRSPSLLNHKFCSTACGHAALIKRASFNCINCGKVVTAKPALARKQRFCSKHCYRKFRGETKPERLTRDALTTLGIAFTAQYPIGLYTIDFYLPDHQIALEVDGEYWHEKQQEQDALRDKKLAAKGIVTIRITDKELCASDPASLVFSKLLRG